MGEKYDAIVIGTGIGGAAIGGLLAHAGWKILILDKNKIIGGRCTSYEKEGFTVDLGVHLFGVGDKGSLGEVCRRLETPDAIDWVTINQPTLKVKDEIKKYSRKNMTTMLPEEEKQNLERLFMEVFSISDEEMEKLWYVPLSEWTNRFTTNKMAHAFIEMINGQYFCVQFDVASTTEFIKSFREVVTARSSAYPRGGCISIPMAYIDAIEKHGGEVKLNARVANVIIENETAVGVKLEDGTEFRAPVIISNADIKDTVKDLVGENHFPADYVEKVKDLTYAYHALGLKVALDEKITDDQLLMYMPYDYEAALTSRKDMVLDGDLPELMGGMITSPTNYDPSLAPEGKQLIFFGSGCPPDQDWKAWEEVILRSFYKAYPQAKGKVLWHRLDTPDLVNAYAGETGNIIGVGQTVTQIHERRPSVVSPLKGLYYSSAEAGGHGIGTELAADSALELSEILLKK
jgi:phytoene dehydrogenase-like protein